MLAAAVERKIEIVGSLTITHRASPEATKRNLIIVSKIG